MINIDNLMELGGNVLVEVTREDLMMFAESVVERTIVARDRQAVHEASKEETYISTKEARKLLGVCEGTLMGKICVMIQPAFLPATVNKS